MNSGRLLFFSENSTISGLIGQALARHYGGENISVVSNGDNFPEDILLLVTDLFKKRGIPFDQLQYGTDDVMGKRPFDLVVVIGADFGNHKPRFAGAPPTVYWMLEDPFETKKITPQTPEKLTTFIDVVETKIRSLFEDGYFDSFINQRQNVDHVLNSLSEGIIAHDLDRKIFFFNHNAEIITGVSREEAIGQDCHDVFSERLCGTECSFCNADCGDEFSDKKYITTFYDRGGERKRCQASVASLKSETGVTQGVVLSLHDLTQIDDLKEQLGETQSFNGIIGRSQQILQVFQQIRNVGVYDYPVYIHGETGTGKELVAAAIHNESNRRNAPFVPINCGALPENLIESELFGHLKGSFTGAVRDKKGRFELADGGTVFLDEVGELSKSVQVKLLRVLQEGTVEKVGSETPIQVNTRIISATNKNLKDEVAAGNFREDLLYRLNVIPLELPPLRDRKEDIPLLCLHFLNTAQPADLRRVKEISRQAIALMLDHDWPGNVRELENTIRFGIVRCQDEIIMPKDLPLEIQQISVSPAPKINGGKLNEQSVREALKTAGGNKSKTAKLLGVGRATLYRFLSEHPELG